MVPAVLVLSTAISMLVFITNVGCRVVRKMVRLGLVEMESPLLVVSLDVGRPLTPVHRVPTMSGLASAIRLVALIPDILLPPLNAMWVYRVPV